MTLQAHGLGLLDLLIGGTGVADGEEQFGILVPTRGFGSPIVSAAHGFLALLNRNIRLPEQTLFR